MDFVRLIYRNGSYDYNGGSDLEMDILGCFLVSDVRCSDPPLFRKWALNEDEDAAGGNITLLDKEEGFIFLSDMYSDEEKPTQLKISCQQFVQLLDEWREKVCMRKPKEVIIKRNGDQFMIEISD